MRPFLSSVQVFFFAANRCSLLLFTIAIVALPTFSAAQSHPTLQWEQTYGGPKNDEAFSVVQTADSGFVLAGFTGNLGEPGLPDYHGGFEDAWVLKLDRLGNKVWEKCLGGTAQEEANSIVQAKDGGYCVAIRSESWDGDVTGYHGGGSDAWIVKLTPDHQIQWEHNIGGSNWDDVLAIIQTADGGFAFAGYTRSDDGDVYGHNGGDSIQNDDAWIVKLDDSGKIQWQKCLGGAGRDWAESIVQTPDGGYAIAGLTNSRNGDVSGFHGGLYDAWIAKLDTIGTLQWQRCFGGDSTDWASSIALTADSGFIVAGATLSNNNGDVAGYHGDTDAWVVKLSATGATQWQKCLGGSGWDQAWSVIPTADGGYAVAGQTASQDGDVSGQHGGKNGDAWIVKLDALGSTQWQQCFGGSSTDAAYSIIQTLDGSFAFTGMTQSLDGDISHNNGSQDIFLAELKPPALSVANSSSQNSATLEIYPDPASESLWVTCNMIGDDQGAPVTFHTEVRNVLGESILDQRESVQPGRHQSRLDLTRLQPGTYFLTLSAPGFFQAAPFQVVR